MPRAPLPSLTVLAASDRGQRTLIDVTYDIGLFTRYLIEGLAGNADLPPIGNGDGELDSAEIYAFTAAYVDLAARKTFGMLQHPVYSSAATSGLATARAAARSAAVSSARASRSLQHCSELRQHPATKLLGSGVKALYIASRISYGTNRLVGDLAQGQL